MGGPVIAHSSIELPAGRQNRRDAILGWMIFAGFAVLLWNIVNMPRTALDLREPLRHFHYSLGLVVSILTGLRLYWWFTTPPPKPPAGLPAGSFGFNRAILLALLLVITLEGFIGIVYTWGSGHDLVLFGLHMPALIARSEAWRMSMGYLHSALGFYYLMLFSIWVAFGIYQRIRYRTGLTRLLPGVSV